MEAFARKRQCLHLMPLNLVPFVQTVLVKIADTNMHNGVSRATLLPSLPQMRLHIPWVLQNWLQYVLSECCCVSAYKCHLIDWKICSRGHLMRCKGSKLKLGHNPKHLDCLHWSEHTSPKSSCEDRANFCRSSMFWNLQSRTLQFVNNNLFKSCPKGRGFWPLTLSCRRCWWGVIENRVKAMQLTLIQWRQFLMLRTRSPTMSRNPWPFRFGAYLGRHRNFLRKLSKQGTHPVSVIFAGPVSPMCAILLFYENFWQGANEDWQIEILDEKNVGVEGWWESSTCITSFWNGDCPGQEAHLGLERDASKHWLRWYGCSGRVLQWNSAHRSNWGDRALAQEVYTMRTLQSPYGIRRLTKRRNGTLWGPLIWLRCPRIVHWAEDSGYVKVGRLGVWTIFRLQVSTQRRNRWSRLSHTPSMS